MTALMGEARRVQRPTVPTLMRLHGHEPQKPETFAEYVQAGGYAPEAWTRPSAELVEIVTASGLRGRGGAAYPTGAKWQAVAAEPGRPVVLVNAAESEPASLKDRMLLSLHPHLVIEGALLAARAVGADECVFYTHDRTAKQAIDRARRELTRAGARLPRWRSVVAPAAYVAGEASAAVNFVNGHDATPTSKPPRIHARGVDGRPTLVHNVETLANVPGIARDGAGWLRASGTPDCPGTILVTLNGAVRRRGVVEVPAGAVLADVLADLGGGTPDDVQVVLPGGYFSGWLSAMVVWRGVTLDPASLRAAGSDLGSAAVTVIPESVCGLWQAARLLRFFADESARQCGPCTLGTAAIADALERVARGAARADDLARLRFYAERMLPGRGACGHLDGATKTARTTLDVFADEIETHLRRGGCGRPMRSVLPGLEDRHGDH